MILRYETRSVHVVLLDVFLGFLNRGLARLFRVLGDILRHGKLASGLLFFLLLVLLGKEIV